MRVLYDRDISSDVNNARLVFVNNKIETIDDTFVNLLLNKTF